MWLRKKSFSLWVVSPIFVCLFICLFLSYSLAGRLGPPPENVEVSEGEDEEEEEEEEPPKKVCT